MNKSNWLVEQHTAAQDSLVIRFGLLQNLFRKPCLYTQRSQHYMECEHFEFIFCGEDAVGEAEPNDAYESLERHRSYLAFIAEAQLDRRLQAKVDLSGVVQQTLFEAHRAFDGANFEDSAARLAWMRKILASNLADEVRKVTTIKNDAHREQPLSTALDQSSARLEEFLVADISSPSLSMRRAERVVQLSAALSRLQPAEREAIFLKNWENKTLTEIADQMERTPAAVAGLLKRGLHKLREEFSRIEK